MATRQILEDLQQAGLRLSLAGDTLRVVPRDAITPAARTMIREHKAGLVELLREGAATNSDTTQGVMDDDNFQERAAICEFDGGLPREWAEGLAQLCTMPRPDDIDPCRWRSIVDAIAVFSDKWAVKAHSLGWSLEQVFGIHESAPFKRVDHLGLLAALANPGVHLVGLDANTAVFQVGRHQAIQRLRRAEITTKEQRLIFEEADQ
ncbi:MAG: hypothetical protein H7836_12300 [Magnetococcus sp. YQC-3]